MMVQIFCCKMYLHCLIVCEFVTLIMICDLKMGSKNFYRHGSYHFFRDAAWELEPGAFQDLLERHNQCDTPNCTCAEGRSSNQLNTYVSFLCSK